ncbi:uncharacterized protein LOC131678403 [Topomyia yanbarensis]|uniref:uncharacterized protein LOC131678403 n=1 Tax=Topomyia yanbarensis TaxID=2498891 RepID=UPI00273A87FF|nr:uncharacterized protein LOC131678403 [Topomyia yanbarensis]
MAVLRKHYVDDYLDSFDTEEEAIKVALDVKEIHTRGGFEIRNWHSNSKTLLQRVEESNQLQAQVINVAAESEAERVLCFHSRAAVGRNLSDEAKYLAQCRTVIQDTWRSKAEWDDEVIETIRTRWQKWMNGVGLIRLQRAYFPWFSAAEIGPIELHVFTDASEEAYASTAYFRAVINGNVYVTLVMAKAKVAPLKVLSVPHLKLMGALLGARPAKAVFEYHTFPICRRIMWTDSETTLAWIQSQYCRYRQFVAFRVGEILSKTEAIEWRWLPSRHNVAGEATKWGKGPITEVHSRWFRGPDFLCLPEVEWPKRTSRKPPETEEEMRQMVRRSGAGEGE